MPPQIERPGWRAAGRIFRWNFMDNFEWAKGYQQRFGIVWVDFDTEKRIPKDSAKWYKNVIKKNGF